MENLEVKPKYHGWKEGVLTENLSCLGGTTLKKGQIVRYKRYKTIWRKGEPIPLHEYEYHYIDQQNSGLIRTYKFLIAQ